MQLDLLSTVSNPMRASRSGVLCPITGFMSWIVVWSLCLLGLSGSFTSRGLGLGVGMSGVAGWGGGGLLWVGVGVGGGGWAAAGAWRRGAGGGWCGGGGMGFWSLWGARTNRSRFAASALSLGRSRQRCCGMRAYRRPLLLRAWIGWGLRSLWATWFWRRGVMRTRLGCVRMLGRAYPTTWCRQRSLFWIVCRLRRTGSLTALRGLGRRWGVWFRDWRAVRGRRCCARCLRRYWDWSALGSTTTFLRLGAIRCLRRV